MKNLKVLIACEESQRVCIAFRNKGIEAYSCDIIPCSGGHPEWHIMQDVLPLLNGFCEFETMDGEKHCINQQWDLIIAHPPCTYLSNAGNGYFNIDKYGELAIKRNIERYKAIDFFMQFTYAKCNHIAIENPVGVMNSWYRKPDQVIHPYFFAKDETDSENFHKKRTCLWLINLNKLKYDKPLAEPKPIYIDKVTGKKRYYVDAITGTSTNGKSERSKTFPGIAEAMADQWGNYLLKGDDSK